MRSTMTSASSVPFSGLSLGIGGHARREPLARVQVKERDATFAKPGVERHEELSRTVATSFDI